MAEIRVTGTGNVQAAPDHAIVNFNTQAEAPTASKALELLAERANAVQDALDANGVGRADRGAQHNNVHRSTRWDGNREIFLGWKASVSITCLVREATQAYALLETVANLPEISADGPHWQIDDDNPAHREARAAAVAAAKSKAQDYADAVGETLGSLLAVVDGVDSGPVMHRGGAKLMSASMDTVDAASQNVSATVTLVFGNPTVGSDS